MEPDDERLSDSLKIAHEAGMDVAFIPKPEKADHPNSVQIIVKKGTYDDLYWYFNWWWSYSNF